MLLEPDRGSAASAACVRTVRAASVGGKRHGPNLGEGHLSDRASMQPLRGDLRSTLTLDRSGGFLRVSGRRASVGFVALRGVEQRAEWKKAPEGRNRLRGLSLTLSMLTGSAEPVFPSYAADGRTMAPASRNCWSIRSAHAGRPAGSASSTRLIGMISAVGTSGGGMAISTCAKSNSCRR